MKKKPKINNLPLYQDLEVMETLAGSDQAQIIGGKSGNVNKCGSGTKPMKSVKEAKPAKTTKVNPPTIKLPKAQESKEPRQNKPDLDDIDMFQCGGVIFF